MDIQIDLSIVTFNSARWLNDWVKSLSKQNYPLDMINLYITDNGSSDNTLDLLRSIIESIGLRSYKIIEQNNVGFGNGHNSNFRFCKSKFVLVSNVDLSYEDDSILNLVQCAKQDEEDIVSWEMRQKPYEHPKIYDPVTLETTWSSAACILIRKSAMDIVGGFEPKIFMYGEDVELSWRFRAHGFRIKYCPNAVCWHYTYEDNKFKKVQFLGSTLSNLYLRLRYGTANDVEIGEIAYKHLISSFHHPSIAWEELINNFKLYQKNRKYFSENNYADKNVAKFIDDWDYEVVREGAFYKCDNVSACKLVSVLIRSYQGRDYFLNDAIRSVLNQTYQNFEIIIVEDGGDSLKPLVESYNDSRIKYFSCAKVGRCVTGNVALNNASGDYFVFLDDDDLFFADHIEVLVGEIGKHGCFDAVYSSSFEWPTNYELLSGVYQYYDKSVDLNLITKSVKKFNVIEFTYVNHIPIQSCLFKRSLFDALGGFDVELDSLEDWDLWLRYSSISDFKPVDKVTSIYRVPACEKVSESRSSRMNSFYEKVIEKLKLIKLNRSMYELRECYVDSNIVVSLNEQVRNLDINLGLKDDVILSLKNELTAYKLEAEAYKSQLSCIYRSKGWRLMKPFRLVMKFIRIFINRVR
ncbi:glycosyltransferase family 2 protein [Francisella philomiragia]|uniref:glycosyltransferase family 2 protein n=1 Tax=Francisella philomiragia TaxID=28110 RepID=UPI001B8CDB99|nr:glycosyltransferase family 2 protein [Francisella philomiragia]QUE30980.1 glycosyltransferase family 2 protein [Francisella philomiragia]